MNDDNPPSSVEGKKEKSEGPSRKSFFGRLGQLFQGEPRDRQELVEVFRDSEENDLIDHDTRDMLEGVIEISEMRVRDIMIPRSQMVTVDRSDDLDALVNLITDAQHSRYPVISEDKDHVEGILLAKDLLPLILNKDEQLPSLRGFLRPAVVVPESKRVDTLLNEFRQQRYHMAIVIDEYGGVSGLVTIEDILEIIVGEIEDEHDESEEQQDIRQVAKHVYAVQALTEVDDFNEYFKTGYSTSDADTIGGIVLHAFGHMPSRGETIEVEGLQFKVTNSDNRRILQLQVTIPKADDNDSEETAN